MAVLSTVETQSKDISVYIFINIIFIIDRKIFLSVNLFNTGIRPTILNEKHTQIFFL